MISVIEELHIPQTEWQVGKTKVFLRSLVHEPLEDARKQMINSKAIIIQREWRRYYQRTRYAKVRAAVLRIQHAYTGWRLRIEFLRKRRACIVIQSHLRGLFAREVAAAMREMRRVEEEMRKRERLEAERKERESQISRQQAEEERKALEECERYVCLFGFSFLRGLLLKRSCIARIDQEGSSLCDSVRAFDARYWPKITSIESILMIINIYR